MRRVRVIKERLDSEKTRGRAWESQKSDGVAEKHRETEMRQIKVENSQFPKSEGKSKTQSQGKPDGPGNRLASLDTYFPQALNTFQGFGMIVIAPVWQINFR
jgi:hypothetical protein